MPAPILTREYIRSILRYDLSTGIFTWVKPRKKIRVGDVAGGNNGKGYTRICIDGKRYVAHRLAFLYVLGWTPKQVDHADHVRSNNSWINLRSANRDINARNKLINTNNTSGHAGVYWEKATGKWRASIGINYKTIGLGRFAHMEDAIAARKTAEKEYGFHPNHGARI